MAPSCDAFLSVLGNISGSRNASSSFLSHGRWEANQWLQWPQRTCAEDAQEVTWKVFESELLARFGPTDYEDYESMTRP